MARVAYLREHATMMLENATQRIPVVTDSFLAAYRAAGKEPVWDLENDVLANQLCAQLKDYNPTATEVHAAELLRACIWAQELGDVPEFKLMQAGRAESKTQANRRIGKTKLNESQKKQILRQYAAAPVQYGAIKSLARDFDVSEDTISRVLNPKKY